MKSFKTAIVLQSFIFFIPITIYVIGDWVGAGIQWALFRYLETERGHFFINILSEVSFILNGTIYFPRTVYSILFWATGAVLLVLALFTLTLAYVWEDTTLLKIGAFLDIGSGISLLLALLLQYGITLRGLSGFVIPIGLPILFIIAYWLYRESGLTEEDDTVSEKDPETGN